MTLRLGRQQRFAPAGSFRQALRDMNPELAARLDAASPSEEPVQLPVPLSTPQKRNLSQRENKPPTQKERHVLRAIVDALTARGCRVIRMQSGVARDGAGGVMRFGEVGLPDLLVLVRGGRAFFVEVKSAEGRLTSHQAAWLERIREWCPAMVARSVDDALTFLNSIEQHPEVRR